MDDNGNGNNAKACIEAGRRIGKLEVLQPLEVPGAGVPIMIGEKNSAIISLEEYMHCPPRIKKTREFTDPVSFCEYVNEFKTEGVTKIYAVHRADDCTIITAVLDDNSVDLPSWCTHKAVLALSPSDEWDLWTEKNKKGMPHKQFAEFLEENISCIAQPDAGELLDTTRKFTVSGKVEVVSEFADGGNIEFATTSQVRGATRQGAAALPRELVLGLRPFKRSEQYEVRALLRFQYSDAGVVFSYALIEPQRVYEAALDTVREQITEATKLSVLL